MYIEIEKKEIILKNEEILLTKEMFEDKRLQLDEEWKEITNYQQKVFGFEGLYFLKKKELSLKKNTLQKQKQKCKRQLR